MCTRKGGYNIMDNFQYKSNVEFIKNSKEAYTNNLVKNNAFYRVKFLPVLTREEEIEFLIRIKNSEGKERLQLRNKFIEHNLCLAFNIAKKNLEPGIDVYDLFQEGVIGLIKAIDKFDLTKEYKFSTYAVPWIHHYIQRYKINNATMIRIPVHTTENKEKYKNKYKDLCNELGRKPSIKEMQTYTEFSSTTIDNIRRTMNMEKIVNIDSYLFNVESDELSYYFRNDEMSTEEKYEDIEIGKLVMQTFNKILTPREKQIIILRNGLYDGRKRTLQEISALPEINLSYQGVAKIEKNALEKLKSICIKNNILEKQNLKTQNIK